MQRELKFRVWSKVKNGWVHNMLLLACIDGLPFAHLVETDKDGKFVKHHIYNASNLDVIIQQFTGLVDKNGVDIYEGDVVTYTSRNGKDYKAEIVFSPTLAAFVLDTSRRHLLDDKYGDYYELHKDHSYEVVGNIFENNELLKA